MDGFGKVIRSQGFGFSIGLVMAEDETIESFRGRCIAKCKDYGWKNHLLNIKKATDEQLSGAKENEDEN